MHKNKNIKIAQNKTSNTKIPNHNISINKSPISKPQFLNIPQPQNFKISNRPKYGKETRQKINSSLQIDKIAKQKLLIRENNNDLFLNYNYNPMSLDNSTMAVGYSQRKTQPNQLTQVQMSVNLLEKLSTIRDQRPFDHRMKEIEKENIYDNYSGFMGTLQKNIKKRNVKEISQKVERNERVDKKKDVRSYNQIKQDDQIQIWGQLEEIINMNEQRQDLKISKSHFNIFHIISDNKMILNGRRDKLLKYNFSQYSIMKPTGRNRSIVPFDNISKFARQLAKNIDERDRKKIEQQVWQLQINPKEINFNDLMSTSSGVVTSEGLSHYLKLENIKIAEQEQQIVPNFDFDQIGKQVLWNQIDSQKIQINYYKNQPFNNIERKQLAACNQIKNKLEKLLQKQQKSFSKFIKDRKLLTQINQSKDQILMEGLEFNVDLTARKDESQEKIVRRNKMKKNRNEFIRIQSMRASLIVKRQYEGKIFRGTVKKHSYSMWK